MSASWRKRIECVYVLTAGSLKGLAKILVLSFIPVVWLRLVQIVLTPLVGRTVANLVGLAPILVLMLAAPLGAALATDNW